MVRHLTRSFRPNHQTRFPRKLMHAIRVIGLDGRFGWIADLHMWLQQPLAR